RPGLAAVGVPLGHPGVVVGIDQPPSHVDAAVVTDRDIEPSGDAAGDVLGPGPREPALADGAARRAAVAVLGVVVVTLLARLEHPVAAGRRIAVPVTGRIAVPVSVSGRIPVSVPIPVSGRIPIPITGRLVGFVGRDVVALAGGGEQRTKAQNKRKAKGWTSHVGSFPTGPTRVNRSGRSPAKLDGAGRSRRSWTDLDGVDLF